MKERVSKSYRNPILDKSIRTKRLSQVCFSSFSQQSIFSGSPIHGSLQKGWSTYSYDLLCGRRVLLHFYGIHFWNHTQRIHFHSWKWSGYLHSKHYTHHYRGSSSLPTGWYNHCQTSWCQSCSRWSYNLQFSRWRPNSSTRIPPLSLLLIAFFRYWLILDLLWQAAAMKIKALICMF